MGLGSGMYVLLYWDSATGGWWWSAHHGGGETGGGVSMCVLCVLTSEPLCAVGVVLGKELVHLFLVHGIGIFRGGNRGS